MPLINEFSVQLHTIREEIMKDFFGVLQKLSKIGYTGVEFAGYGGISAVEMKKALDGYGLKAVGSHIGFDRWELERELEYNQTLGTQFMVIPYRKIENREGALRLAEELSDKSEKCVKAGFKFGYHNHAHEFAKDGGDYLLDILVGNVDKSKVCLELDVYWAAYAGVEPVEYIEKNKGLVRLVHIKQMKDYESRRCVDLDEGVLDFGEIIKRAKAAGAEHFILEQEAFEAGALPLASVEKGFRHIMGL